MYGLGLSCWTAAHLLGALAVPLTAMTVWRDAQEAGGALRRTRPGGTVRVLGADETVYRVKGTEVVVGFVTDGQSGVTLGFTVLGTRDGIAFQRWLAPYVATYGVEVLVSDEHGSYGVAADALGLEHQLCLAHVRKAVTRRRTAILAQATEEWGESDGRVGELTAQLDRIQEVVRRLPATGGRELEQLHRSDLSAVGPRRGEQASVGYRMRLLTLELWEHWPKLRVHLSRPELQLDGTNNGTERAIGKSKVRYKTMRGYKSLEGLCNGIALTQWLYSGAETHDLAAELAV